MSIREDIDTLLRYKKEDIHITANEMKILNAYKLGIVYGIKSEKARIIKELKLMDQSKAVDDARI